MAQPQNLFAPQTGPRVLLTFRAGRLELVDGWVRSDARRGVLTVVVIGGIVHVQWRERNSNNPNPDESIPVYPRTASFARIEKCTTGRVYGLSTVDSSRVHFFWMQEPNASKDDEYCEAMNRFLSCPSPAMLDPNMFLGSAFGLGGAISQEQLIALLASRMVFMPPVYGATGSEYGDSMPSTARRNQVELSTLQGILRDLGQPQPSSSTPGAEGTAVTVGGGEENVGGAEGSVAPQQQQTQQQNDQTAQQENGGQSPP